MASSISRATTLRTRSGDLVPDRCRQRLASHRSVGRLHRFLKTAGIIDPRERGSRVVERPLRLATVKTNAGVQQIGREDRAAMIPGVMATDLLRKFAVCGVGEDRRSVDRETITSRVLEQPVQ